MVNVFSIIVFFTLFFLIKKSKFFIKSLSDNDFNKPQSFHKSSVMRCGGILMIVTFILFWLFNYNLNYHYLFYFGILNFFF